VPPPKLAGHQAIETAVFLAFFGSAEYFDHMWLYWERIERLAVGAKPAAGRSRGESR
jgi:hypothetical protein